jgi:aspartyl-tRNA(Asn)/glutamyl-tRNA(Gln) amidotransferase subunit B
LFVLIREPILGEPAFALVEGKLTTVATDYETVIGLEVHVQLDTKSKMFCSCSHDYSGAEPNTHVCPVCMGMPGMLPVINEQAIRYIVTAGLAMNCEIAEFSKFDRKNYLYPDLVKGYQISQFDLPLCIGGWLDIEVDGVPSRVNLTRIHMEEDTARLMHRTDGRTGDGYSLVDLNRSGTPLMEIVSEPDIRSAEEARAYLVALRRLLRYTGVSKANMEEGQMRCDANISLRPRGQEKLGIRAEVKNMNSFRAVYDALKFEEIRQAEVLNSGGRVVQETRGWVDDTQETVSQRSKEEAEDYRYFPDPDLPPLTLSREYVQELKDGLPEMPVERHDRYIALDLSEFEANTLADARDRSDYADAVAAALGGDEQRAAKLSSNWVLGEVGRWCNEHAREVSEFPIEADALAELIKTAEDGKVTGTVAKQVFESMIETGQGAAQIIEEQGLAQIGGADELTGVVQEVISQNEKAVADYRAGKDTAVKYLMGQVMRATKGRANPQTVQEIIVAKLGPND